MQVTKEELIQIIVKEVLKALPSNNGVLDKTQHGVKRALVLGDAAKIPDSLKVGFKIAKIDEYIKHGDIGEFDRVIIAELSFTELSDIALCRNSRPIQCAIIMALLCEKDVLLLESGLPIGNEGASSNRLMFAVIESYIEAIQSFGVRIVKDSIIEHEANLTVPDETVRRSGAATMPDIPTLITESVAKGMIRTNSSPIQLSQSTIITPLARDVFHDANIEVKRS